MNKLLNVFMCRHIRSDTLTFVDIYTTKSFDDNFKFKYKVYLIMR